MNSKLFSLENRGIVLTGASGFLAAHFAEFLLQQGAQLALWDIRTEKAEEIARKFPNQCIAQTVDITQPESIQEACDALDKQSFPWWGLVNNACINPRVEDSGALSNKIKPDPEQWALELSVGITGAWNCSSIIGQKLADRGDGRIVNIGSDLAVIAPDQRIYLDPKTGEHPLKPATYSAIKAGIAGLTRYLATLWPDKGVRANTLSPAGVANGQDPEFVERLNSLIPIDRMCKPEDLAAPLIFLLSPGSSYVNGHNLLVDGGRTIW
ncbi:MAG: SDR family oxidoreductase [Opitutales bacterium]